MKEKLAEEYAERVCNGQFPIEYTRSQVVAHTKADFIAGWEAKEASILYKKCNPHTHNLYVTHQSVCPNCGGTNIANAGNEFVKEASIGWDEIRYSEDDGYFWVKNTPYTEGEILEVIKNKTYYSLLTKAK